MHFDQGEFEMLRMSVLVFCVCSSASVAQSQSHQGHMHAGHGSHNVDKRSSAGVPKQGGQSAFAAIQEVVEILEADPKTDWSKVNIEALRLHLIDMDNVTLRAVVKAEPVDGGMRFEVSGDGAVGDSIRKMTMAHAHVMDGTGGWKYAAQATSSGAIVTVMVAAKELPKLKGLGFAGLMARGMHHQQHHLMIARGASPHH
jgi:hypothetical protein